MLWAVISQRNLLLSTQSQTPVTATAYNEFTEGDHFKRFAIETMTNSPGINVKMPNPKVKRWYTPLLRQY